MRRSFSISSMLFVVLLAACRSSQPGTFATFMPQLTRVATPAEATYQPRFESHECWGSVPAGISATCGYVIVPENRRQPLTEENTIRLAVVILRAQGIQYAQPPTVLLGGGPGQDMIGMFSGFFRDYQYLQEHEYSAEQYPGHRQDMEQFLMVMDRVVADLQKREFIYFDQRGAGYSQPSLKCHGEDLSECRNRLVSSGVDIAAYNTLENAADVNNVRLALGYEQINLQGGSYGTRLALEVMRSYPQIIRAAVLDGVTPPQIDWAVEMVRRYDDALQVLFDHCQADLSCDAAYPALDTVFSDLVERLNTRLIEVQVGKYRQKLNGDDLRDTVWNALYDAHKIRFLPMMIAQANNGNPTVWGQLLTANSVGDGDSFAWGLHYSVECAERWAFETPQDLIAASEGLPLTMREAVIRYFAETFRVCEQWNVPQAPAIVHTPVHSDAPTLLFSGEFDPGTPPAFAEIAAETLTQNYNYILPYRGHTDGFTNLCQSVVTSAFLDDPYHEPNTACINDMDVPTFVVP